MSKPEKRIEHNKIVDNWTQFRTAYFVAQLGTVTAAADAMGLHRATVIRHVDAMEQKIGTKLFQRHAQGYTRTEAGDDLMEVGHATERRLREFIARSQGLDEGVHGELVLTTIDVVAEPAIEMINRFQKSHPTIKVNFAMTNDILRLEYGEAHVAIRGGSKKPSDPDCVVQPLLQVRLGIYAHQRYLDEFGAPKNENEFAGHKFIMPEGNIDRHPCARFIGRRISKENIALSFNHMSVQAASLYQGLGISFFPSFIAEKQPGLIEVMASRKQWDVRFWLVAHRDINRSAKVQAFIKSLKADGMLGNQFRRI